MINYMYLECFDEGYRICFINEFYLGGGEGGSCGNLQMDETTGNSWIKSWSKNIFNVYFSEAPGTSLQGSLTKLHRGRLTTNHCTGSVWESELSHTMGLLSSDVETLEIILDQVSSLASCIPEFSSGNLSFKIRWKGRHSARNCDIMMLNTICNSQVWNKDQSQHNLTFRFFISSF